MNKLTVAARKREIIIKNWINTTRIGVALQISQENWRKVPKKQSDMQEMDKLVQRNKSVEQAKRLK
jgi:hypothetical protein